MNESGIIGVVSRVGIMGMDNAIEVAALYIRYENKVDWLHMATGVWRREKRPNKEQGGQV